MSLLHRMLTIQRIDKALFLNWDNTMKVAVKDPFEYSVRTRIVRMLAGLLAIAAWSMIIDLEPSYKWVYEVPTAIVFSVFSLGSYAGLKRASDLLANILRRR